MPHGRHGYEPGVSRAHFLKGESMDSKATIFNIQRFSIHDGPGIRTVVFLKGCHLRCLWCANPESNKFECELLYYPDKCIGCGRCIEVCPQSAICSENDMILFDRQKCIGCLKCTQTCNSGARKTAGEEMTAQEAFEEVSKDFIFYDTSEGGVTFSGGEPMLYPKFIRDVGGMVKEEGFGTAIETCGIFPTENFDMVRSTIDVALYDLKFIDSEKHTKYCGAPNELALSNFEKIIDEIPVIARMPVIPGINDTEEDIDKLKAFLRKYRRKLKEIDLLPYHNLGVAKFDALGRHYPLEEIEAPGKERMAALKKELEETGLLVKIGG